MIKSLKQQQQKTLQHSQNHQKCFIGNHLGSINPSAQLLRISAIHCKVELGAKRHMRICMAYYDNMLIQKSRRKKYLLFPPLKPKEAYQNGTAPLGGWLWGRFYSEVSGGGETEGDRDKTKAYCTSLGQGYTCTKFPSLCTSIPRDTTLTWQSWPGFG